MYGLVNKGLEDLIRARHGDATWERVCQEAGIELETFLAMSSYPDEVTFRIVGAACRQLGEEAAALLEAFGEHWIRYTAQEGYGELFALGGGDLVSMLGNLDRLHGRIATAFPKFRMPHFECIELGPGRLRLVYRSERAGLAPMVVGLVRGLGAYFSTPVAIQQVARREDTGVDEFEITHGEAAA